MAWPADMQSCRGCHCAVSLKIGLQIQIRNPQPLPPSLPPSPPLTHPSATLHPALRYWESVNMARKLSMALIMTFITDRRLKIYCAMWALTFFLILQVCGA